MSLHLELPAEEFGAIAAPVLERAAGLIAARLAKAALAFVEEREAGYMDKQSAAAYLKIEVRALEYWMRPVSKGGRGLPYLKLGETVRFRRSRIDAWALGLEVNPPEIIHMESAA